jgi:hypothetical protein
VGSSPTPGTKLATDPLWAALAVLDYNYAINLRAISLLFLFESRLAKRKVAARLLLVLVSAALCAQAPDIIGWRDFAWGSGKAAVLKALKSSHIREASADELVIDEFRLNGMSYRVGLFFLPKYGLGKVTMTSEADRDSFQKALSDLTSHYGKPGLRAEYDGDREITLTVFQWTTPHGRLSLSSDYGDGASGLFTIVYESVVNR